MSAKISTLMCSRSKISRRDSRPRLARKAPMDMFRLVSGVTISVLVKSMEPSPGCGMGKPTPMPAEDGTIGNGPTGRAAAAAAASAAVAPGTGLANGLGIMTMGAAEALLVVGRPEREVGMAS
jgi:hypothetical protein